MSVNEKILDAIELLTNNSIQQAGYDKTIQAQIISCQDPSIGKYKCRYQDAILYAYTSNPDMNLSKGTYVYILVPENNMSKDKTILGTVDKLGADYVSMAVGEQAYNVIGSNVLHNDAAAFYLDVDIKDYSYDIYDSDNNNLNLINLNVDQLNQYIKQASSLIIGMNVQTNIPQGKRKIGSYGIKYVLQFKDDKGNTGIDREYILDEDKMIDNPYHLVYPTRQYAIFDIDSKNFIKVKKITIFNKDFPDSQGESHTSLSSGQIELTNLELKCAVRMTQEELNGLALSVIAPRGIIFLNTSDEPKILKAQVKFKGRVMPATNISFYWGIEDLQITPQRDEYNKYLGRGWKCINGFNEIQSEGGARSIQWASYGDTYQVPISEAATRDNRIKVAAVYEGNVITKQINIQNLTSSAIFITIRSLAGTDFYYGVGQTRLQCSVSDNVSYSGELVYAWGWQNNGGQLQQLSTTSSVLANVEARYIYNFAIYRCSVYDRYNGEDHYIGTASIKLTNSMQGEGANPLIIQNGTALYKYNEKGISPTSRTLQNRQIIQVLKFKLYDDVGNEIQIFNNNLIDSRATVKWKIPKENTLLKLIDSQQSVETDQAYYIVSNTETLSYDIAQRYDARKTINQIILQVTYNGATSRAQTNLTFTKQGQIGTNGTDYYVEILPNTLMANPPLFPMITRFGNSSYRLNYGLNAYDEYTNNPNLNSTPLLKVEFLHGGQPVSSGYTVKWRILRNHYYGSGNNSIDDASDFTINESTGIMTYTDSLKECYEQASSLIWATAANIVQCEITYDGHIYYGAIPFITAYMVNDSNTFELQEGTGFHYVMYSSEGMQPEYSSQPFNFTDGNNGECKVLGNIRRQITTDTWSYSNSEDLVQDNQNQFKIQPIGFYKGECVNNSVRYKVNGIGVINIPIHFYLNRYSFAHLNGWDGNSIQINNQDGYILAPQMAAGAKDTNNRFTGVLMGEVKNPMKNRSDIGLFGYNQGSRSFFVNSKNGSALFGNGKGQIIIDPGTVDSNGNVLNAKAMLYSHDFWLASNYDSETGLPRSYNEGQYADAGMLIDLTTPQIVFKNKMLWLTSDGAIYAGKRTQNNTNYYNFSVDSSGNVQIVGDIKAGRISGTNNYNFEVNNSATNNNPLIRAGYNSGVYNFNVTANGDVSLTGDITATSGYIGTGSKKWQIGTANDIYANSYIRYGKQTLDDYNTGIYIGTDGISINKGYNENALTIDLVNGTSYFDLGTITLSKDTSISWGTDYYGNEQITDIETLVEGITSGTGVPDYINHTFINGTTIESPTIYAGKYYATGDGNSGSGALTDPPAYYIYNGHPQSSGIKLGYISYDSTGAAQTSDSNANRILFRSIGNSVIKIQSATNLSLETGAWQDGTPLNNYMIYLMSDTRVAKNVFINPTFRESQGISWTGAYWAGGSYGTEAPDNSSNKWTGLSYDATGMLYFKLVNN